MKKIFDKYCNGLFKKLLISLIIWLVGAITFTGITLYLTWKIENISVDINNIGTLRKRIFHMIALSNIGNQKDAILYEQKEFNKILADLSTINIYKSINLNKNNIQQQINNINKISNAFINKLLNASDSANANLIDIKEAQQIINNNINPLIKFIEQENSKSIQLVRFLLFLLIFMVLLSTCIAVITLNNLVIRPLNKLDCAIKKITAGNLSTRINVISNDEFGTLSKGLNNMAESLADLYENLEDKVIEKTIALEEKNKELTLLYELTSFLNETNSYDEIIYGFMEKLITLFNADAITISLSDYNTKSYPKNNINHKKINYSIIGKELELAEQNMVLPKNKLLKLNNTDIFTTFFPYYNIILIKLNYSNIGSLYIYFAENNVLQSNDIKIIKTFCNQLSIALENQRLLLRDKELAVTEERKMLAQELHDSIAQTLSFLNLQVQMLENAINHNNKNDITTNVSFIKQGIQESYANVRELLVNFRVEICQEEFYNVLNDVIHRFENQSAIQVNLKYVDDGLVLNPEQKLQVILILQESLSNIRKHANASLVTINIENLLNFVMEIIDNGIGFDVKDAQNKTSHIGLKIIQERAKKIAAHLEIKSIINFGTSILLTIKR